VTKTILTKDREYGKLNIGEFTGIPCAPFFLQEFYDITFIGVKHTLFPVGIELKKPNVVERSGLGRREIPILIQREGARS
jgi:hypothetical protein